MNPKIGIVPGRVITENRPFKDQFLFVNNYPKRIEKAGGIPIGVIFPNGNFKEEYLEMYDGFLFPGGSKIWPYQVATLHYAITHNKPVLGVCLGSQLLGAYSYVIERINEPTYDKIIKFYETIMDEDELFLKKVEGHDNEPEFYNYSIPKSKHKVYIDENSRLFDIYKNNIIEEPSIHNFVIKESGPKFKVIAKSEEGYIEALEYNNPDYFILGVQFHPELEDSNDILFKRFIEETKKRKWLYHFFLF